VGVSKDKEIRHKFIDGNTFAKMATLGKSATIQSNN
jgi:hypothetical protein